ncbi:contractile injection system protein, VgrG/Pvc8 family, partial [Pseudoalteromonas denitrificans]
MSKNIINITYNNLTFKVIKLVGNEYLSNHFEFNVTIETESENLIKSGLAQTVKIQFISVDGHTREHTSCLFSIQNLGCFSDRYRYILTLKPRIEILNQQQHSRILIDTNVKQIINNLMVEAGYNKDQIEWRVSQSFDNIPQFIQAQENNFQLLQRLLHQFGLFYWSEPKNNTEIVVFTDNNLHSPYLERGLVEVINADGMNREYVNQFVGFNAINVTHNVVFGSADSHVHSHPPHANKQKCEQQFFEPCANNTAQQNNFSQIQSQANLQNEKVIILTGNIPDVFAGCSISLDDTTHASGSGDYLCIAVKHHLIQVNDESTHNGNNEYHCIATFIPRGTPFKVVAPEQFDKPMVFPATVESLSGSAQLNDQGEYNVRLAFDTTARPQTSASSPLKKLALYACANQNQATGWHFPLIKDAKVLIGCINNDPSNAFILGFALNDNQTSVVDENNPYHNRLLTLAGNELLLDDSPRKAKVVLHTLGQAHYIELNASQGDQFVKWISNYGAINFYSGKNLSIGNTEPMDISFILKNNMFIDINKKYNVTTNNQSIQYQSAGSIDAKGNTIQLNSEQEASLLSGRTLKATAQSEIKINSDNANININVPAGSTFIQADNNINIKGDGSGDIIIHNKGAQIKLSASGDVDIIATDVLTLNGAMTTFDGPVSYDITSPESASEPSVLNQTTIARSPNLDVSS